MCMVGNCVGPAMDLVLGIVLGIVLVVQGEILLRERQVSGAGSIGLGRVVGSKLTRTIRGALRLLRYLAWCVSVQRVSAMLKDT